MQYLIVATRSLYVIRLLRLKYVMGPPEKLDGGGTSGMDAGNQLNGIDYLTWAKLTMGATNCFLKAYKIYVEFLDVMYGLKIWPEGRDPEGGKTEYPECVERMKAYLQKNILFNMARGFSFFILHNNYDLKTHPCLPIRAEENVSPEYVVEQKRQADLPYHNYALAQYGLAIIRPFMIEKDRYQKFEYALGLEEYFNRIIKQYYPRVTPDAHSFRARPRHRIVNHAGLMTYLPFIKEYMAEECNSNYAFRRLTPFFGRYLYTYPSESIHIYPNYISSIAFRMPLSHTCRIKQSNRENESQTFDSLAEGKKKWKTVVQSFEKEGAQ